MMRQEKKSREKRFGWGELKFRRLRHWRESVRDRTVKTRSVRVTSALFADDTTTTGKQGQTNEGVNMVKPW